MTNIGIFDSGLGGIAVLNEISKNNNGNFYYLGDNLRVPYGNKDKKDIKKFATEIVDFLEKFDIDYYIIACNTISVTCKDYLIEHFNKKFIAITDAAIKAACSFDGDFLALATKATVDSHFYKNTIEEKTGAKVYEVKAEKLVDLIESANLTGDCLDTALDEYLSVANEKKIENIILACTHYPIIKEAIENRLNYKANIIDPAVNLSREISINSDKKRVKIYMTKKTIATESLISKIMGCEYELNYVGDLS